MNALNESNVGRDRPGGLWNEARNGKPHPGGFRKWRSYPRGAKLISGFTFGAHSDHGPDYTEPYKADILLVSDGDSFRIIYKGEAAGIPGPYLTDFFSALSDAHFIPVDAPAVMWWPSDSRFWDDYQLERSACSPEKYQEEHGLVFDRNSRTATGSWLALAESQPHHRDATKVIVEIVIGVAVGVTTQGTVTILRAGLRKVKEELHKRRHPVKEIVSEDDDDWPFDRGYL